MWQYKHTDELMHYGVPGMTWGKRKKPPHNLHENRFGRGESEGNINNNISSGSTSSKTPASVKPSTGDKGKAYVDSKKSTMTKGTTQQTTEKGKKKVQDLGIKDKVRDKDKDKNNPTHKEYHDKFVAKQKENKKVEEGLHDTSAVVSKVSTAANDSTKVIDSADNIRRTLNEKTYDTSSMSYQELSDAVNRINMENNYNRLMNERNNSTPKGMEVAKNVLSGIGAVAATAASVLTVAELIKKLMNKN